MSACDGEVLGLQATGNGRSCVQHDCCGMLVVPNDIIKFKTAVIDGMGMREGSKSVQKEAIKAVLIAMEQSAAKWVFCGSPLVWLREINKICWVLCTDHSAV